MNLLRLALYIISIIVFSAQIGFCADSYRVNNLYIDNSDRIIFIQGSGNFKTPASASYVPIPSYVNSNNSVSLINNISSIIMTNPSRFVVDIPDAILTNPSRTYKFSNSIINNIVISQFSLSPNVVRVVVTVNKESDLSKFKLYSNGEDIFIKYGNNVIDNSIQYKFYTISGDMDKSNWLQNTSAIMSYNNSEESMEFIPRLQTKYYLGKVSQNSDGLILRGLGSVSLQRASYSADNSQASIVIDNASVSSSLDNKTFKIPSTITNSSATLTINRLNSRKIKLTLLGESLRDYRFVISPDGQSIFVSHRTYVVNTPFSSEMAKLNGYKTSKTNNGYRLYEFSFSKAVTYDVFELNDSFYLDIDNLSDFNEPLFKQVFANNDIKIQAMKISSDKTRYIIPMRSLNFAYANVESNSKSIKLCFKDKPVADIPKDEVTIANVYENNKDENKNTKNQTKSENINVLYIPKEDEENNKIKNEKIKKKKENPTISSIKKVVIDPGHGGADSGAISGSLYEKTLNLEIAKLVEARLTKKNIHVYMTRSKDETLTLEERVSFSNEISPDIYVSIHANSTLQGDSYGLETHYYKDDSYELAQKIHSIFASEKNLEKWETKDRGVIKSRFYVINHTEAPSILIEIGFISNATEKEKLLKTKRQEEIADSITKGILEYLKK